MPKPKWLGDLEQIQIANPAAGAAVDIQPPGGQVWLVEGIAAVFSASVAVANRNLYILQRGGIADVAPIVSGTIILASQVRNISLSSWFSSAPFDSVGYFHFPLSRFCYITNTIFIRIFAFGMDAADQFSAIWVNYYRMLNE